jgi:class 3 adenylate cyclase
MFVADFVKSTQLVRELEGRGISPIEHFNGILNKICEPINQYDGYIIGYHGDNVHAVFLGVGAINRACKTAVCILNLWKHENSPLTPNLRIGLARGPVAAGWLGATQDKRLEVIGSAVNEAFSAASGDIGKEHGSEKARIFFGPSLCSSQRHRAA